MDPGGNNLLGSMTAIDMEGGYKQMMIRGNMSGTKYAMLFSLLPSTPLMFTSKLMPMNEMTDRMTE